MGDVKYLPLIWAGIWRKRGRAVLLLLQIVSAFILFGLLQGLNSGIKEAVARTHRDRLYVGSSVSLGDPLPLGMLGRIQSVAGVRYVSARTIFPSTYQKPGQVVPVSGVDPAAFFAVYDEYIVAPEQVEALKHNRTGLLVGMPMAKRYGWKVGQHIALQSPLQRTDGAPAWTFDVVGVFDAPEGLSTANFVIANFDYVNQSRLINKDRVELFAVKIDNPANAAAVSLAIDNAFANSEHETRTQSEGDLANTQIQRIADLDFIVGGIISAVFFALLLATGALMMQSIRERIAELAVMKTVGFSDRLVMVLILVEAVTFCLFAAGIGLAIASLILPMAREQIGIAGMPFSVVLSGLGFAITLALLGGLAPAWRGMRVRVADALADR
jgi:putative ABC transport system permease protein